MQGFLIDRLKWPINTCDTMGNDWITTTALPDEYIEKRGWTSKRQRAAILASLTADPHQLCKICGMPLAKCRQLLGLETLATHAAIRVVDEPTPIEPEASPAVSAAQDAAYAEGRLF